MQTVENSEEFVSRFGPRRPLAPVAYTDGSAHASGNTSRFTGRAVGWFLDLDHVPKVAAHLPASTSEELIAMATSMTEKRNSDSDEMLEMPRKKKMKLKGRNKKRPQGNRPNPGAKLCTKIVHGLEYETHDHEQLNCGHGLSNERPHSIDACCQNKPDSEDVLGTETAGLDSESCKLVTACIEQQPAGDVSRDSSNVVVDDAENNQSLSVDKEVSSSGNTTGVPVSTVPSDSVDIPDIATLKVQRVGPGNGRRYD
ncbi:hypothetical protein LSAT2_010983 [Lamellibrachia satsuma]|nr:hypothetical protein LSAT2_010983 [Lamellibrachia satsuma]